jgi:hypothetical protein
MCTLTVASFMRSTISKSVPYFGSTVVTQVTPQAAKVILSSNQRLMAAQADAPLTPSTLLQALFEQSALSRTVTLWYLQYVSGVHFPRTATSTTPHFVLPRISATNVRLSTYSLCCEHSQKPLLGPSADASTIWTVQARTRKQHISTETEGLLQRVLHDS